MTIIVGMTCIDGAVIASDSQAGSFRGVHMKRLDYTKIYDFSFDGAKVILTGAGETSFITRAKEIIEAKAADTKIHSPREVADIAEDAMTAIQKRYVVDRYRDIMGTKAPTSQEDMQIAPPNFELMLGVRCGREYCLYAVYPDGVASREEGYASSGSGSPFAEYLLARLYRSDLLVDEAVRVGVYVIEEVKKIDTHCGGATQVIVLKADSAERKTETEVRATVQFLDRQDTLLKDSWRVIAKGPEAVQLPEFRTAT